MKRFALLFVLLSVSCFLFSQDYFDWSEEQIITDTLSNYSNSYVVPVGYDAWMFYQKNETNSSIWKMNLTSLSGNMVLLDTVSVNFTNPTFIWIGSPDYLGYLFYLSDIDGYQNLWASKYYENDSVGESIAVCQNLQQEEISEYSITSEGFITFVIDSTVHVAELKFYSDSVYTENEKTLYSYSYNAQVRFREVAWIKKEAEESHIYISFYNYNEDAEEFEWTEPEFLDSIGNCSSLTKSNSVFGWGYNHFCWVNNNYIKVFTGSSSFYQCDTINNFDQNNVRQISMVNWDIAVKYPYELPHYTAFAINQGEASEIFSSHGEFGNEDSAHISNNLYMDENPKLFFGESVDGWGTEAFYVYCVWQSHINNNIALSMSKAKAFIGSKIDENVTTENFLKVSPNPFRDRLKIAYNSHNQNGEIKIVTINGELIAEFNNIKPSSAWESLEWVPESQHSKGIYMVIYNFGNKQISTKVILNK